MGSESYYIFIDADNTEINPEDLQALSGKRVGVNKGSYQMGLLQDWMEKNHFALETVELTGDEADSMRMLSKGEMDAFVSLDNFAAHERLGHEIGDRYIKEACRLICERFQHSPVYRIGGDEFVAVLEGSDYENRRALLAAFEQMMDANLAQGNIAVASGCAVFDPSVDRGAHTVLERADSKMYQRKKRMKARGM